MKDNNKNSIYLHFFTLALWQIMYSVFILLVIIIINDEIVDELGLILPPEIFFLSFFS